MCNKRLRLLILSLVCMCVCVNMLVINVVSELMMSAFQFCMFFPSLVRNKIYGKEMNNVMPYFEKISKVGLILNKNLRIDLYIVFIYTIILKDI